MANKAICASCHASTDSIGATWKNQKGQHLVKIKSHWNANREGIPCSARVGVVAA